MDDCSDKRAANRVFVSRKGSGFVSGENMNNRDKNVPVRSRIGCSARISAMKGTQTGSSDKAKSARTSSTDKERIGSTSRTSSAVGTVRKSSANTGRQLSSLLESDSSDIRYVHGKPEPPEPITPPEKIKRGLNAHSENTDSNARSCRSSLHRFGLGNRETVVGPSVYLSPSSSSQLSSGSLGRNGLRNLRYSSKSDLVLSGSSSSVSSLSRKKDLSENRNSHGEGSSSTRGKKMSGLLLEGRNQNSSHGVPFSDSRTNRYSAVSKDNGVLSVSTQRPTISYRRIRHSDQGNENSLSPVTIPEGPQTEISVDLNLPHSAELSFSPQSSCNIDGIAEVLLALERIERDEELRYEQLLALETNLFLGGLNLYDQHRDLRLDIDNMSYEELLALEERMGSVSTALSEEALSKCLKKRAYQSTCSDGDTGGACSNKDDVKCSICQEEYGEGEEVGRLNCEHRYHVGCIQQWLRMKNWCPICKASAESSSLSSWRSS